MKKIALLLALILTMSIVGCGSDNSIVSPNVDNSITQKVTATEGDPLDTNDGSEGDPDGMGTGNG